VVGARASRVLFVLVGGVLRADVLVFPGLLLGLDRGRGEMERVPPARVRAARAVEGENVVSRLGGDFGRGAGRELKVRDVIDRNSDAVLLAPILSEGIEPAVVLGNEMTPLQDFEGLGLGAGVGFEWR